MDDPFTALADPTRRSILDRLRSAGPLSVTELASELPMTRQAVRKHLGVLEAGGLVRARKTGRERIHHLEPEPLDQVRAWLEPYSEEWDRRLERLRKHLEDNP